MAGADAPGMCIIQITSKDLRNLTEALEMLSAIWHIIAELSEVSYTGNHWFCQSPPGGGLWQIVAEAGSAIRLAEGFGSATNTEHKGILQAGVAESTTAFTLADSLKSDAYSFNCTG